jgi:hypothetical protein
VKGKLIEIAASSSSRKRAGAGLVDAGLKACATALS